MVHKIYEMIDETASMKRHIVDSVDDWSIKHPRLSFAIIIGGMTLISYKLTQSLIAGAVCKGNLKAARYFYKMK